jgi:hypothetical protein
MITDINSSITPGWLEPAVSKGSQSVNNLHQCINNSRHFAVEGNQPTLVNNLIYITFSNTKYSRGLLSQTQRTFFFPVIAEKLKYACSVVKKKKRN